MLLLKANTSKIVSAKYYDSRPIGIMQHIILSHPLQLHCPIAHYIVISRRRESQRSAVPDILQATSNLRC